MKRVRLFAAVTKPGTAAITMSVAARIATDRRLRMRESITDYLPPEGLDAMSGRRTNGHGCPPNGLLPQGREDYTLVKEWRVALRRPCGACWHRLWSGAGHRAHRVDADDDRADRVERQLVADVAATEEIAEQPALTLRQADEHPLAIDVDDSHLVVGAVDREPAAELVHRHVGATLDEPTELRRRGGPLDRALVACLDRGHGDDRPRRQAMARHGGRDRPRPHLGARCRHLRGFLGKR